MALDAVQHHILLAIGNVFNKRLVFAKASTHLVKVGDLQVRSKSHITCIGREFAQNQAQERRLSRAIRAHNTNAVSAGNFGRKPANQRRSIIRIAHIGESCHQAPRTVRLGNLHVHVARSGAARCTFFTHFNERAHAALVTGPPRLDSFANPDFFFGQALVEKRIRLVLFGQGLIAELHKLVVRKIPTANTTAVQVKNTGSHAAHKGAVMAHKKQGTIQAGHDSFEPLDCRNVQMVRGFVQQQQVRVLGERLRKKSAAFLATAQTVIKSLRINPRFAQNRLGMSIVGAVLHNPRHDHIADRALDMGRNFLNHARNPQPGLLDNLAGLHLHLGREHL